jgi:hypothetical protein
VQFAAPQPPSLAVLSHLVTWQLCHHLPHTVGHLSAAIICQTRSGSDGHAVGERGMRDPSLCCSAVPPTRTCVPEVTIPVQTPDTFSDEHGSEHQQNASMQGSRLSPLYPQAPSLANVACQVLPRHCFAFASSSWSRSLLAGWLAGLATSMGPCCSCSRRRRVTTPMRAARRSAVLCAAAS